MPYTPDATDVTNPIAGTVKAATAAAEFIAIKLYMRDVLLAGLTGKAALAGATFSGNVGIGAASALRLSVTNIVSPDGVFVRSNGFDTNIVGATVGLLLGANSATGAAYVVAGGSTSNTSLAFFTAAAAAPAERLRIDSIGNVGIGTNAPARKLEVVGTALRVSASAPWLELSSAGIVNWSLRANNSASSEFAVFQDNTERMRIDANGNFGVGTATPTSKLHVAGPIALSVPTYVSAATYTVAASDSCIRVAVTCTITLPAASSCPGRILRIANIGAVAANSASNNVAQQATGTTGTAIVPATPGKWADMQSDGSFWYITASN